MENLEAPQDIVSLGKRIVAEMELDPGVDTLSKWMAHYLAGRITDIEKLKGEKRKAAEKECFDTISALWQHRWNIPRGKPFLEDFDTLFRTLHKLNPEAEGAFFPIPVLQFGEEESLPKKGEIDLKSCYDAALAVDKYARSLIYDLLRQGVSEVELSDERRALIEDAIMLMREPDTQIIRFTTDYNEFKDSDDKQENDDLSEMLEKIEQRIQEVEAFGRINDSLLKKYQEKLKALKKGGLG